MDKTLIKFLPLLALPFIINAFTKTFTQTNTSEISNSINDTSYHQPNDSTDLVADGATLQLISKQFKFTEGPAVDRHGNVYFTDQPNDKIWKYSIDRQLSVFLDKTGRSNGLFSDKKGNLIACADEQNQLCSISADKNIKVLVNDFEGKKLNGPNDVWVDKKGGIYFTDPYYQRDYWTRKKPEITGEKVYYFSKRTGVRVAADNLKKPNGIIGTADRKFLYVADIGDNKTYRYTIKKDGTLVEPIVFAQQGSDGMTIDNKGNIYLTGNGVTVYNSEGKKIKHIPVSARWTANVCFGGKDMNKLFITASEALYVLDMKVHGVQ